MSVTNPPIALPQATLSMPNLRISPETNALYEHFGTSEFLPNLIAFHNQVGGFISSLQYKKPGDAFEIKFQFNFYCNSSTEVTLSTDKDVGTLTLSCYCNGPG